MSILANVLVEKIMPKAALKSYRQNGQKETELNKDDDWFESPNNDAPEFRQNSMNILENNSIATINVDQQIHSAEQSEA